MATVVKDTFTRADTTLATTGLGSTETGQTWATSMNYNSTATTWQVSSNQAKSSNTPDSVAYVNSGISDATVSLLLPSTAGSPQLVARKSGTQQLIYEAGKLYTLNGSTWTQIGTGTTWTAGDTVSIKCQGSTITCYVNGVQAFNPVTSSFNQTGTGFGIGVGMGTITVDNFQVDDLNTGPTGTTGSKTYNTKQAVYTQSTAVYSTKQTLSAIGSKAYATQQNVSATGVPGSQFYVAKQAFYAQGSQSYVTKQAVTASGVSGSITLSTKQTINRQNSIALALSQRLYQNTSTNFATKQQIFATFSKDFATLIVIDTVKPTFGSIDFSVKVVIHNMFVIQHDLTSEKFMFPHMNIAKETYEGFEVYQAVPVGFSVALDQTPVPLYYMSNGEQTDTVRWEANSADPLKTMNKWEND